MARGGLKHFGVNLGHFRGEKTVQPSQSVISDHFEERSGLYREKVGRLFDF